MNGLSRLRVSGGSAVVVFVLICGLLSALSATAQIVGINASASLVTNRFDDTQSYKVGHHGFFYLTAATPWSGSAFSITQTDPATSDSANGSVAASFSGYNYFPMTLNNVTLTQNPGNTGYATLSFSNVVDFTLGAGGLPSAPVQYPSFLASGTVQSSGAGYASLYGALLYIDVNAAGVGTLIDAVNYSWSYNTPGTFGPISVNGSPTSPNLPAIPAGDSLTVVGDVVLTVDPASVSVETVPEPSTFVLAGIGLAGLLAMRRRTPNETERV